VIAFFFSSLVGIGIATVSDALNTTIYEPEQVTHKLAADVIAMLPRIGKVDNGYSEAIRTLRDAIVLGSPDSRIPSLVIPSPVGSRIRSLVITSPGVGEGKTTIATNLAAALTHQGRKTLLIDADLRHPKMHRQFGLSGEIGLATILSGDLAWRSAVQPVESQPDLFVIPAGPLSDHSLDIMVPRLSDLLAEFKREYDLVIIDAPPLLGFAEPLQLAATVDGVLLVVHAGRTKIDDLAFALSQLNRLQANVIGIALNQMDQSISSRYTNYYKRYRQQSA
jgi:polysaccharide biosynthesis transport protein